MVIFNEVLLEVKLVQSKKLFSEEIYNKKIENESKSKNAHYSPQPSAIKGSSK